MSLALSPPANMDRRRSSAFTQMFRRASTMSNSSQSDKMSVHSSSSKEFRTLDHRPSLGKQSYSLPLRPMGAPGEIQEFGTTNSSLVHVDESNKLGELFFALPTELHMQILYLLPFNSILSFRLTACTCYHIVHTNEGSITRNLLKNFEGVPEDLPELYPTPGAGDLDLYYLLGFVHRLKISRAFARDIADFVTVEVFHMNTTSQRQAFAPKYDKMRKRMIPMIFTLFQYFENFREALLSHSKQSGAQKIKSIILPDGTHAGHPMELEILQSYSTDRLIWAYRMYSLFLACITRQLRPPSYAGSIERSLRGWSRDGPPEENLVKLLLVGGVRETRRIFRNPIYRHRRQALDDWCLSLSLPERLKTEKGRRASVGIKSRGESCPTYGEGYPMPPLTQEECSSLLPHLPKLKNIFVSSANRVLIHRGFGENLDSLRFYGKFINDLVGDEIESPSEIEQEMEEGTAVEGNSTDAQQSGEGADEDGTQPTAPTPTPAYIVGLRNALWDGQQHAFWG